MIIESLGCRGPQLGMTFTVIISAKIYRKKLEVEKCPKTNSILLRHPLW